MSCDGMHESDSRLKVALTADVDQENAALMGFFESMDEEEQTRALDQMRETYHRHAESCMDRDSGTVCITMVGMLLAMTKWKEMKVASLEKPDADEN